MANDPRQNIHAKIVELAQQIGGDASALRFDQVIPDTGFLDSAAIMELIIWLEGEYGVTISQEDLTLANFGTIDAMSRYLARTGAVLEP